jgi:ActR/RegA family two-component response regulator
MALECLILTSDSAVLAPLRTSLGERKVAIQFRQDYESAVELVSRRHLDGLVVDCDDVPGGSGIPAQVRGSTSNKQTLTLAIVNGTTNERQAIDLGADFALSKPLQENRLQKILEIAIPRMEREHRRYFRFEANLPVRFRDPLGQSCASASIQNISEGGVAIKLTDPSKLKGVVIVEFEIPSVEPQPFQAKAEIIWSDSFAMGLRFLYIEKDSAAGFQSWLNSLEARMRFHESSQQKV